MKVALIPARMGSQRLPKKNLRELNGVPLIVHAIRKCQAAGCFDEIWVNSEDSEFRHIAAREGVHFHHRPEDLGSDTATSEEYVTEFLLKKQCEYVFQVHSIAPLLTTASVVQFVRAMEKESCDTLLSVEDIQIECMYGGAPVNFTFERKTNSQDLEPVRRVSWSITGWRRETFLDAVDSGQCATYSGTVRLYGVNPLAAHVIKTELDLQVAEALLPLVDRYDFGTN